MSFRDTFTRGSKRQQNLQYDDNAAYHFYITLLILITLPLIYSILKSIINPFANIPLKQIEPLQIFRNRLIKFKKENQFRYLTIGFLFKIIITIFMCFLIVRCVTILNQSSQQIKGFDPYQILQVNSQATIQQIKKSYRKLALKYHPDRNQDDPQASAKFIMISKAYECLTNQQAKSNCLKFGNPEGSASFNVGIALPSFLVKKSNQVKIMAVVFIIVVIILPIILIYYHGQINKYDDHGMILNNHPILRQKLNQNFPIDNMLNLLPLCYQFRNLTTNLTKQQTYNQFMAKSQPNVINTIKKNNYLPSINKAIMIIGARVNENQIPQELMDDFRQIMKNAPIVLRAIVMYSCPRSTIQFKKYYRDANDKFIGIRTISSIIQFGQHLIQGRSYNSDSYMQLSLTQQQFEITKKKRKQRKYNQLPILKKVQQQRQYFLNLLQPARRALIAQEINYIPTIDLETSIHTGGEEDITQDDLLECLIKIKTNRKSNFCSAPTYPFLKMQGWYVLVAPENKPTLLYFDHFSFQKEEHQIKFKMAPFEKGFHCIEIKIFSDCYFGIDVSKPIKFEVLKTRVRHQKGLNEEKLNDQQEAKLDDGLFSRIMGSILPKQEQELSDKQE